MSESEHAMPRTSRAAMWAAADYWTQQTAQLLTFILIGNILGPHVVGVMTLAFIAVLFFATSLEGGFAEALVQRANLTSEHFGTAFWLMLGVGAIEGLVLWAMAPFVALLFSEPQLNDIIPLMAIGLPFVAVSACYKAMLRRELKFRQLAVRSVLAYGSGFVVAIISAALSFGIYSLVMFFLASRVLDAVFIVAISRLRPGTKISRAALSEIVDFGKHCIANQFAAFITAQVDRIVIGIAFDPTVLGLYSIAERLVAVVNNGITGVIHRVAFSILAARQSNRRAFESAMREFLVVVNGLALPVFIGLALTSPGLIDVLFRSNWAPAAPLMQILCLAALTGPSNYVVSASASALGRPNIVLRLTLVLLVLRVASSLGAAQIGVAAIALARAAVSILSLPMLLSMTGSLFDKRWYRLFHGVWVPALAALLMGATVLAFSPLLAGLDVVVVLACQVLIGVVTYSAIIALLAPGLYPKALQIIGRPRSGQPQASPTESRRPAGHAGGDLDSHKHPTSSA